MRLKVNYHLDWDDRVSIAKIREDLDELEKLGVKEIDIKADDYFGSLSIKIEAFYEREETDDEFQKRVAKEKRQQEEQKRRELQELERLKSKYEQL